MTDNESARPGPDLPGTGATTAGEHVTAMVQQATDHARRSRRWAGCHLDELLDVPPPAADLIDYEACGLTLTVAEREAAGAVHPWRVAA